MGHIVVAVDDSSSFGEAAAVDEAGVVEGVAEEDILLAAQSGENAYVGGVAAGKNKGVLAVLKSG